MTSGKISVCDSFLSSGESFLILRWTWFSVTLSFIVWSGWRRRWPDSCEAKTIIKPAGAADTIPGEYPARGSCGKTQLIHDSLSPTSAKTMRSKMLFLMSRWMLKRNFLTLLSMILMQGNLLVATVLGNRTHCGNQCNCLWTHNFSHFLKRNTNVFSVHALLQPFLPCLNDSGGKECSQPV